MKAKRMLLTSTLVTTLCLSAGCATNTGTDALVGGAAGAGIGAALGRGPGALVGGAIGAVTGAAIGNNQDAKERQNAAIAASQRPSPLSVVSIVQMTQSGWTESQIIDKIRGTYSTFQLSQDDLNYMSQWRVSPNVVAYMQQCRPAPVVYAQPYVYTQPAVIVTTPPPPPVAIGVGVGFR